MPSSKSSPGPHDRDPNKPRQQCIAINRFNGKRCRRWATQGRTKLCRLHFAKAKNDPAYAEAVTKPVTKGAKGTAGSSTGIQEGPGGGPDPSPGDSVRAGVSMNLKKQSKSATALVISAQSKAALAKLGQPYDPSATRQDPKEVLLALVASAWQQAQVWQAMLATVPDADWAKVGMTPVPGDPVSSKGARIEAIQKFLGEATKTAARISKMAVDAGIEERLVRIAEEQQALIADTVRAGLIAGIAQLHLNPQAEKAAIEAALGSAANHLRRLAAGTDEVVDSVEKVLHRQPRVVEVRESE